MWEIRKKLAFIIILTFLSGFLLLPNSILDKIPLSFIPSTNFHFWLDLKWWTHLDYKIDLRKIEKFNSDDNPENDVKINDLISWILATLSKRVNSLWVSEPNIYSSKTADEHHVVVELAWIQDIEKAKAIVWKTIQLEFKTRKEKLNSEKYRNEVRKKVQKFQKKLRKENFLELWEKEKTFDWKITFTEHKKVFKWDLPKNLKNIFWKKWLIKKIKEVNKWKAYLEWEFVENNWFSLINVISSEWNFINYQEIFFSSMESVWKNTGLDGSKFKRANVVFSQVWLPIVNIEFDDEWWKMFWELTTKFVWKQFAIFVWGSLISAPVVNEAILWGSAQISWNFTIKEAVDLKNDLNTWAIWAPIILSGQNNIDAAIWAESLKRSLQAWITGLIILLIYMVYQYRLFWIIASIALILYSIFLLFVIKISWNLWMPIILTLAWTAGIILSIWMAVDANILIFERIKEELKDGKNKITAISIWFDRAWTSIRDSNISSLITCVILIWFWTSMIRWFAINLWIWILISMFSALTVTKTLLLVYFWKIKK